MRWRKLSWRTRRRFLRILTARPRRQSLREPLPDDDGWQVNRESSGRDRERSRRRKWRRCQEVVVGPAPASAPVPGLWAMFRRVRKADCCGKGQGRGRLLEARSGDDKGAGNVPGCRRRAAMQGRRRGISSRRATDLLDREARELLGLGWRRCCRVQPSAWSGGSVRCRKGRVAIRSLLLSADCVRGVLVR